MPNINDKNIIWLDGIDTVLVKYHNQNGVIKQYKYDSSNKNSLIINYIKGTGATKASSSGTGLTFVKYVAELHDGYVRLDSEINKGSIFTIGLTNIVQGSVCND